MGAINVGLKGRSYDKLSNLLGQNFEELYGKDNRTIFESSYDKFDLDSLSEGSLSMKSALFCPSDIFDHYKQISRLICGLDYIKINSSNTSGSALAMNEWTSLETYGSVINLFNESMVDEHRMVFIDTFSFTSDWTKSFNFLKTKKEIFIDDKGQKLKVDMMNHEGFNFVYDSPDHNFRILFKPFNDELYAAIVLPRDGYGIKDVLEILNLNHMQTYYEQSPATYVDLKLPKFKIVSQNNLVKTFKHFGIIDIFNRNNSAFGGMTNDTVFIENLIQVTNLCIDEVGTPEAVDTVRFWKSLQLPSEKFYVKRPFLFFLFSYKIQHVILSAVVTHPKAD
ncbi:Leukocyte elastase inhibitor [Thelohanellus kitauei]|uniref:Leukocyte elastase inhibitor n=1 Tax=Thelohanellus kitauei TaxID=669202 RepID=A0A0C2MDG1_THEKT|nr:Leukocyte elastase inhibitor [Thelohanellus kitauei]